MTEVAITKRALKGTPYKLCCGCNTVKLRLHFTKQGKYLKSQCRTCLAEIAKDRNETEQGKILQRKRMLAWVDKTVLNITCT